MAINRVEINDFLVFKGKFEADFCPGINVLFGANATGKTTLLKAMYMNCDSKKMSYEGISNTETGLLKVQEVVSMPPYFLYIDTVNGSTINTYYDNDNDHSELNVNGFHPSQQFVFIPTTDMLSHSKGFLPLYYEREIPFDVTYVDIISKAGLPSTRNLTPVAKKVLDKIKGIIGGEVVLENDIFYIQRESGEKTPFTLEASGYRKFGLLWKLLRNGLLEAGSILFWDEPENSLSPELIPILVDILLELSRNGVQVFVATHSEILASYFAVNREKGDIVMFTSLFKEGEQIKANTSDRFDLLEPNKLTAEIVHLYEKQIVKGLGGNV